MKKGKRAFIPVKIVWPKRPIKITMLPEDLVIVFCILFSMGAMFLTRFYVALTRDLAASMASLETVVKLVEANPFQWTRLAVEGASTVMDIIVIPALMVGLYAYLRIALRHKVLSRAVFRAYMVFFVMATAADFLNDLGIVLGVVLRV